MAEQQTNMSSSSTPQAVVKKNRGISPIWILPLLAVVIGAWLIYKGIANAPIDAVITFQSGEGITAGKTQVMYKGIEAGTVQDITINPDFQSVNAHIEFNPPTSINLNSTNY
jgi:paraquat-inducible protein B